MPHTLPINALCPFQVRVVEKMDQAGKKVLISGGTRCNVLPAQMDLQRDFVTESSQSAMRAVFRWVAGWLGGWLTLVWSALLG